MEATATSLARNEIRLEDGTITEIAVGDIWIEFDDSDGRPVEENILNRYTIHDIVTDAIQVETTDGDGETHIGDYELHAFRENASSGHLKPKSHVFTVEEPPDATQLNSILADVANSGVAADELMYQFQQNHHAIQQRAFTDIIKPLILALATQPHTDRRNENAVDTAQEIVELLEWETPDVPRR